MSYQNLFDPTGKIAEKYLPPGIEAPSLQQVLTVGNNAEALDMYGVQDFQANSSITIGNGDITLLPIIFGLTADNTLKMTSGVDTNNGLIIQSYNGATLEQQLFTLDSINDSIVLGDVVSAEAPKVYVSNNSGHLGLVYDTYYNVPTLTASQAVLTYFSTGTDTLSIPNKVRVPIRWANKDITNSVGTIPLELTEDGGANPNSSFLNTSGSTIGLSVSGYVTFQDCATTDTLFVYASVNDNYADSTLGNNIMCGTTYTPTLTFNFSILLPAGEYFNISVNQSSGGALNINPSTTNFPNNGTGITYTTSKISIVQFR